MNKPRLYESALIKRLKAQIPAEMSEQNDRKMGLAVKIASILSARGLSKQEFAFMMQKKPSEISRWLSGTHNFTTETLWEIERVLKVQLLVSSPPEEPAENVKNELKDFVINEVKWAFEKFIANKNLSLS